MVAVLMRQLHVRMPDELLRELQRSAADNHRSVNREIVWRLKRSLEGYSR